MADSDIDEVLAALADGRPVVVIDEGDESAGEPGGGDLVVCAAHVNAALVAFLARHGSGCEEVAADAQVLDRLDLPPMALAAGPDGSIWVALGSGDKLARVAPKG